MSDSETPPRMSSLKNSRDSRDAASLEMTASSLALQPTIHSKESYLSYLDVEIQSAESKTILYQNLIKDTPRQDNQFGKEPPAIRYRLRKKAKLLSRLTILKSLRTDIEDTEDGELIMKRLAESHNSQIMDLFKAMAGDMNKALNTGVNRKSKMQAEWIRTVVESYDSREVIIPDNEGEIWEEAVGLWCPIFQSYGYKKYRTAAHIMSLATNPVNASYLLSKTGGSYHEGVKLLWSPGNGLILHHILKEHFDKGTFTK